MILNKPKTLDITFSLSQEIIQNIQQIMKNIQKLQIGSRDGVEISEFVKFWFGIFNRTKNGVLIIFMLESF